MSLGLLEPDSPAKWDRSPAELALWREYEALLELPPEEFMEGFFRVGVKGVDRLRLYQASRLRGWPSDLRACARSC